MSRLPNFQRRNSLPGSSPYPLPTRDRDRDRSPRRHNDTHHRPGSPPPSSYRGRNPHGRRIEPTTYLPNRAPRDTPKGIFENVVFHFVSNNTDEVRRAKKICGVLSANGARGVRTPEDANVIFVHVHPGPLQKYITVLPSPPFHSYDECRERGKYSRHEVYMYFAARTGPELVPSERKHVLQPSWVEASLQAGRPLRGPHFEGYEIKVQLPAGPLCLEQPHYNDDPRLRAPPFRPDPSPPQSSFGPGPVVPRRFVLGGGQPATIPRPETPPLPQPQATLDQSAIRRSHDNETQGAYSEPLISDNVTIEEHIPRSPPNLEIDNAETKDNIAFNINTFPIQEDVEMLSTETSAPEEPAIPNQIHIEAEPEDRKPDIESEWFRWDRASRKTETWRPPPPPLVSMSDSTSNTIHAASKSKTNLLPTEHSVVTTPPATPQPLEGQTVAAPVIDDTLTNPSTRRDITPALIQQTETTQPRSHIPLAESPAHPQTRSETPGGVFARQLKVHVLNPDENKFAVVTITRLGGAVIAPFDQASIIIVSESGLRTAIKEDHRRAVQRAAPWQIVVSIDWVTQCLEADQILINFEPYRITLGADIADTATETATQPDFSKRAPAPKFPDLDDNMSIDQPGVAGPSRPRATPSFGSFQIEQPSSSMNIAPHTVKIEKDDDDDIVYIGSVLGSKQSGSTVNGMYTPPRTPSFSLSGAQPGRLRKRTSRSVSSLTDMFMVDEEEDAEEDDQNDIVLLPLSRPRAGTAIRETEDDLGETSEQDDDSDEDEEAGISKGKHAQRRPYPPRPPREIVIPDMLKSAAKIQEAIQICVGDNPEQRSRFHTMLDELELWKKDNFRRTFEMFFQRVADKHAWRTVGQWKHTWRHWKMLYYQLVDGLLYKGNQKLRGVR